MKNPTWQRDELILALDLYFNYGNKSFSKKDPRVIELSAFLNHLPFYKRSEVQPNFRNPTSVVMKLGNFQSLDATQSGKGLSSSSKLDQKIWNEFSDNRENLEKIVNLIKQSLLINVIKNDTIIEEEEESFLEGRVLYIKHKSFERNSKIVTRKKEVAEKSGLLNCEICGFDFYKIYGVIGKDFIECHHIIPVSEYGSNTKTTLENLALVCSNCHRMLHRTRPWLSPVELKRVLRKNSI